MALLAGVTQPSRSRVSDVTSNQMECFGGGEEGVCPQRHGGEERQLAATPPELLRKFCSGDRESITLLNFLGPRGSVSDRSPLSHHDTPKHTNGGAG